MAYPNIFSKEECQKIIDRIESLTPQTQPEWGKMNVAQMLAHCDVAYQMVYQPENFKKANAFTKLMVKLFAKKQVIGNKPYPKNSRTAPDFIVPAEQDFQGQKTKLINHIWQAQQDGEAYFDGKESHAMGKLSADNWNVLFSKHLDHHLRQFGV